MIIDEDYYRITQLSSRFSNVVQDIVFFIKTERRILLEIKMKRSLTCHSATLGVIVIFLTARLD